MPSQAFALRDIRLSDLPALKRWRSWPDVQRHLRNPTPPTWYQQFRWWRRIQRDPTCRVWAVTLEGELVGQAGWYYRKNYEAEVSVLVMDGDREAFETEGFVLRHLLTPKAREAGLTVLWAEVLATAPLKRHTVFPVSPHGTVTSDQYSTIYRWSIG